MLGAEAMTKSFLRNITFQRCERCLDYLGESGSLSYRTASKCMEAGLEGIKEGILDKMKPSHIVKSGEKGKH